MDDNGQLKPIVDAARIQRATPKQTENCANDSFILETILHKYNPHKIPGGQVSVEVEGMHFNFQRTSYGFEFQFGFKKSQQSQISHLTFR